ncbi:MAG: hypothetical protein AB7G12_11760 [Thermoanaerobaculia bacterium]
MPDSLPHATRHRSRRLLTSVLLAAAAPAIAVEPPTISGWIRLSGGSLDAAPTFLDGGYGKLVDGGRPDDVRAGALLGEARLALDWEPAVGWRLFVHGAARLDPESAESSAGSGLLEAYVERRFGFGAGQEIDLRLGQFFLPSSRENVDPLWTSPYTLTLSAMNAWIAEEVRPIGLDASWSRTRDDGQRWALAATVFGGNDTSGSLLAWRGFALHDRPTPIGRLVPLPTLADLATSFPEQDARGSRPFGSDLDGRPGFAGRARWDAPGGRAVVQATAFLNNGDRDLYDHQYSWKTDFRWLSTEVELPAGFRLLGEWGTGFSEMGFAPPGERSRSRVDIRFDTYYAMLSWQRGPVRTSLRYDDFLVEDRDSTPGDDNREDGSAWTLAVIATAGERWRFGAELLYLDATRPAAVAAGSPDLDALSFRLEARFAF